MSSQQQPVRITIYNHKGGVGKTTLTINIASALAALGKSVLLVDSDPQCNLTSYLLSDDVVDDLLDNSETSDGQTIWTSVKPVYDEVGPVSAVKPLQVGRLYLVPGDIRLSEFEEFLSEAWTNAYRRRLGGFRALTSINDLVSQICSHKHFDYVFFDTGPNIGPLNRILLLGSDFFIVPVACDLFSVRALSTLGQTLKKWIVDAGVIASLAPDDVTLLPAKPRFIGYIPQRFKMYGQTMAEEPARYLRQIRRRIFEDVSSVLKEIDPTLVANHNQDPVLGQVKDFASLVQTAQREGVSLWRCSSTYAEQKDAAKQSFAELASKIVSSTNTAVRKQV